jgi:hypothetical protein
MAHTSEGEARIVELETEIALERDRATALDTRARRQDAEHRFRRLDLVAQLGAIEAGEPTRADLDHDTERMSLPDDPFPDDDTLPSVELELDVDAELKTAELRQKIDDVDRLAATAALQYAREIGLAEDRISEKVDEVKRLRDELVPVYTSLASLVKRSAKGRSELDDHVKALAEVVGAIQIYQSMLRAADS